MVRRAGIFLLPILAIVMFIVSQKVEEVESHTGERPPPTPDWITATPTYIPVHINLIERISDFPPTPTPTATISIPIYRDTPVYAADSSPRGGCSYGPHANHPNPYCPDLIPILSQYSWPLDQAIAVISCESAGDANAQNPSGANGLFQVIGGSFDPYENARQAWSKYLDGLAHGNAWYHWNQFGSCGWF